MDRFFIPRKIFNGLHIKTRVMPNMKKIKNIFNRLFDF